MLTVLTVDIMDVSGSHQSDLQHSVWKKRLDKFGNEIEHQAEKQGWLIFHIW